jgi:hypothetical protein
MGYRSDIALGISFPSHDALIAFASAQRITGDERTREALKEYFITHHRDGCVLWAQFESVKWYPDDPDVMAHNKLLTAANDAGYRTFTAEIGEAVGDIKWEVRWADTYSSDAIYELFGIERKLITPEQGKKLGE